MDTSDPNWVSPDQRYVTTAQAAQALGVHVSTIKRWVDSDVLPASYTAGRHRKILVADILRLYKDRDFPRADTRVLFPKVINKHEDKIADLAAELVEAIRDGNGEEVRGLIHGVYHRGCPMARLADEIIAPAMHQVGSEWHQGTMTVLQEHHGTQFCLSALYELQAFLRTQGRSDRPNAVGAAPEHDHYLMPTLLAKMVLLEQGWNAINLGPHTPMWALESALDTFQPQLVWLSVTHLPGSALAPFVENYKAFRAKAERKGVLVALGGQGLPAPTLRQITIDLHGSRMADLAAFARSLHAPVIRRPSRGRPPGS